MSIAAMASGNYFIYNYIYMYGMVYIHNKNILQYLYNHFFCSLCVCVYIYIAGVLSVKLDGEKKDEVVLIGDSVDAVGVTTLLRKKIGHATLESVDQLKLPD